MLRGTPENSPRHCMWCEHWGGPSEQGTPFETHSAVCLREAKDVHKRTQAWNGCSSWVKDPGLDFVEPKLPPPPLSAWFHVDEDDLPF